jgi:hypothetical protein
VTIHEDGKIIWWATGRDSENQHGKAEAVADQAGRERGRQQEIARQQVEESKREVRERAPEILGLAKKLLRAGKQAQEQGKYREAGRFFQRAIESGQDIIGELPNAKEATEARQLVTEAKELQRTTEAKVKAEYEAARKLSIARRLARGGQEEEAGGNSREAERLRGQAAEHYREIVKSFPGTQAAAEAQALLDGKAPPDRPQPPDPGPAKSHPAAKAKRRWCNSWDAGELSVIRA